ncbi:MAG TPA: CAP domain-containing protein [Acidimicrobiales bacterium]|nr:CAP domain-containing protein [Acidimicrobiales bacterium]
MVPAPEAPEPSAASPVDQPQLLAAVNATRTAGTTCGSGPYGPAAPLTLDADLAEAAEGHAVDMATNDLFSHTGSDGSTPDERISVAGYAWTVVGENLAAGDPSATGTVAGWFASTTHCATFMDPRLEEVGFARADDPSSTYGVYWVAALGAEG